MLHITPAACISANAGGPGPEPSLISVSNTENQAIACGQNWRRNVGWTLDFTNDVGYEIEIYDNVRAVVIVSGLLTSSSPYVDTVPGAVGDTAFTGFFHSSEYIVRLVRKADSAVADSLTTALVTVETGAAC